MDRLPVGIGERVRIERVDDDAVCFEAGVVQPAERVDGLVDGHLLRKGHEDDAGAPTIPDQGLDRTGLVGDAADPGDLCVLPRRAQEPEPVAGRRRVEDDEVVPRRSVPQALLGQVPDLPEGHQLTKAGGGRRQIAHRAAVRQPLGDRPDLECQDEVLLEHLLRVDREAGQARNEQCLRAPGRRLGSEHAWQAAL